MVSLKKIFTKILNQLTLVPSKQLVWQYPDSSFPTSMTTLTITNGDCLIPFSDFDMLEFLFKLDKSNFSTIYTYRITPNKTTTALNEPDLLKNWGLLNPAGGRLNYVGRETRIAITDTNTADDYIQINTCYRKTKAYTTTNTVSNSYMFPYKIYGIRGGLE